MSAPDDKEDPAAHEDKDEDKGRAAADAPAERVEAQPIPDRAPAPPFPVLRLLRPLAGLALLATVFGRILGPAWAGIAVGMGRLSRAMELTGAALTQLFAMVATVIAMAEILAAVQSRLPILLRIVAVGAGGFVVLVGLSAAAVRVPGFSMIIIGASAALMALVAAWDARRVPFARPAALTLALVGAAALGRLASIGLAYLASERGSLPLASVARGAATASFLLEACAVLTVIALLAAGRANARKIASPLTTVILVLAFIATRQALAGDAEDAGIVTVLLRRAADRFLLRPEPFLPAVLRIFVGMLAVLASGAALFARGHVPALIGAASLALLARGSVDVPLCALLLVIASIGVALAARDDRGVWAAIVADERGGRGADPPPQAGAGGNGAAAA